MSAPRALARNRSASASSCRWYTDELQSVEGTHALVFRARVGDRELEGVDLLRTGADGLVVDLTAIIRPLSGLAALAATMGPKALAAGLTVATRWARGLRF
jgi:hypothetical protein